MLVWEYLLGYGGGLFFNYWRNEELGWVLRDEFLLYFGKYFWINVNYFFLYLFVIEME